jgi:protein phosphatase
LTAIDHTNSEVREYASTNPDHRDMGTTLTVAYLKWPWLYVIHVGDSRCYLLDGTDLKQLTTDHTVAEMLAEMSSSPGQETRSSRLEHVLTNAIGGGELDTSPEVLSIELAANQLLLLCTDGLTKHLSDDQITAILREDICAEARCRRLIEEANSAGGRDNITAIIADFQDAPTRTVAHRIEALPSTKQ